MAVKSVLFAHLDRVDVEVGQRLKKGDIIGLMGNTGVSNGAHLHMTCFLKKITYIPWMSENPNQAASKEETYRFMNEPGLFLDPGTRATRNIQTTIGWLGYNNHYAYDLISGARGLPLIAWNQDCEGVVAIVEDFGDKRFGKTVVVHYPHNEKVGVDLSEFQEPKKIDYTKLAKQVAFAIIRVGGTFRGNQGSFYHDDSWEEHYKNLAKYKVPMGCYWYSTASTTKEGVEEAKEMLSLIRFHKWDYPIVIDVEEPTCTTEAVIAFCKTIEDAGYYAMIYANTDYLKNRLNSTKLKPFDIWLANWTDKPESPLPYGIWQYTSQGRLNGYSGYLDLNRSFKDYPSIIARAKLNPVHKKPVDRVGLVNFGSVNLRDKPSLTQSKVVGSVKKGEKVTVVETVRDGYEMTWHKLSDGKFIKSDFIDF